MLWGNSYEKVHLTLSEHHRETIHVVCVKKRNNTNYAGSISLRQLESKTWQKLR